MTNFTTPLTLAQETELQALAEFNLSHEELAKVQAAVKSSDEVVAADPTIQSITKLTEGRNSVYRIKIEKCKVWEGNRNRVNMGDIPAFARYIMDHGIPAGIEGFVQDGLLNITEGARRLTAIHYAVNELGYIAPEIIFTPVTNDPFKLYARQINSEKSLVKSSIEKRAVILNMGSCVKEDGSRYTQAEIAKEVGMSVASVSIYMSLQHATDEVLQAIDDKNGITSSDVIQAVRAKRQDIRAVKLEESEEGFEEDSREEASEESFEVDLEYVNKIKAENKATKEESKGEKTTKKAEAKSTPLKDFAASASALAVTMEKTAVHVTNDDGTITVQCSFTQKEFDAFFESRDRYFS